MKRYGLVTTRKKGQITEKMEEHEDGQYYRVDEVDRYFKDLMGDFHKELKAIERGNGKQ